MSKNFKKYCVIVLILLVVYNVLSFAIPFQHKNEVIFWVSWSSGLFALICQPFIMYYALKNDKTLKSKIYGLPIIFVGFIYLLIQLIVTILFYILGSFIVVPSWILIVIVSILIGISAIGLIVNASYKDELQKQEERVILNTAFIDNLRIETKQLANMVSDSTLKSRLDKLVEFVQYSDPVSSEIVKEIEVKITSDFSRLKKNVTDKIFDTIDNDIDDLMLLIQERNEKIKAGKR